MRPIDVKAHFHFLLPVSLLHELRFLQNDATGMAPGGLGCGVASPFVYVQIAPLVLLPFGVAVMAEEANAASFRVRLTHSLPCMVVEVRRNFDSTPD